MIRSPAHGPAQLNVVPYSARVLADLRTIPAQDHEYLKQALLDLGQEVAELANRAYAEYDRRLGVERKASIRIKTEILDDRPATLTSRDDPLVESVHWALQKLSGSEPVYAGVPGATDGTFLWARKGIPIVTIGAGEVEVPHQVDEWVDLDQLYEAARLYILSALAYLDPDAKG